MDYNVWRNRVPTAHHRQVEKRKEEIEAKIAQLGERMTEDHKVRCSIHLLGAFLRVMETNNSLSSFVKQAIYIQDRATNTQYSTKEKHKPRFHLLLQ